LNLPFDPNVHLGPFQVAWHGIFTAVGIFFGVWLPVRILRGRVSEDAIYALATPAVIGGIVGARLFHVIDCWSLCGYDTNPLLIPQIWTGGIAIMGAVIVGALTGYVIAVRRGDIPIGGTADAAAAGIGRTTLHKQFPTRLDLLVAVASRGLDIIESVTAARPGSSRVAANIEGG